MSLYKYPEKFHDIILNKGAIGWRQVFNGRISTLWLEHQGNTKTSSKKIRMNYTLGASIVQTCLQILVDLWEMRNEEVHGKEEATTKQKREDKAAITVRALHKLEEQAPAGTLEGFIAMKTRPINNSVRERAKQSRSRVKLIVDWIRIGEEQYGINRENREEIKRTLSIRSTHKTKEQNKMKGQYSIFYDETNSSECFYIPKGRLY